MMKVSLLWCYNTRKKNVSFVNCNHDFEEKVFVNEITAPVHRIYYSFVTIIPANKNFAGKENFCPGRMFI